MRRAIQFAFLALTLLAVFVLGAHAEAWCPMGGVEALYTYWHEGNMLCSLGVSNFYILGGVLALTLVARRAFCGFMCPLGTISEWLGLAARRLGAPRLRVGGALDRVLSLLKYAVLAAVLFFTWRAGELLFRGFDPCYALISRHGADITAWAYVSAGAVAVGSLFVSLPFCRWFCPLAAVLNPLSRIGLARVKRDAESCRNCGRCARACPMAIPVDRAPQVTHARCLACQSCVDHCPQAATGALAWGPPARFGGRWPRWTLAALILLFTGAAVGLAYAVPIPSFVKTRGEPPIQVAATEMRIDDLTCRGRANLLFYYLERDDLFALPGYLRLEAWPGPGWSRVRVEYDSQQTSPDAVRQAITEAYFDAVGGHWRMSPFRIEGYDPLGGGGNEE